MAFRHQTPFTVKTEVILEKLQQELQGRRIKGLGDDQRAVLYDVLQSFSRQLPGDSMAVSIPSSLPININSTILDIALWFGYRMCRGYGSCSSKQTAQEVEEAVVPQVVPQLIETTGPSKSTADAQRHFSILAEEQPCCSKSLMRAQPAVKSVSAKKTMKKTSGGAKQCPFSTNGLASNAESTMKIRRSKRDIKTNCKYFNKDHVNPKTKGLVQVKEKPSHSFGNGIPKAALKHKKMKLKSTRSFRGGIIIPKNAIMVNQGLCKIKLETDFIKIGQPDDDSAPFDDY